MSLIHAKRSGYVYGAKTFLNDMGDIGPYRLAPASNQATLDATTYPAVEPTNFSIFVSATKEINFTSADSAAFGLGTNDFTIEGWFYAGSDSGRNQTIDFRIGTNAQTLLIGFNNLTPYYYAGLSDRDAASSMPANTWTHVAWCRNSSGVGIYMGGNRIRAHTSEGSLGGKSVGKMKIGESLSAYTWTFRFTQIRITIGTCRYNDATYTVPSSELTADGNTTFLFKPVLAPKGITQSGLGTI